MCRSSRTRLYTSPVASLASSNFGNRRILDPIIGPDREGNLIRVSWGNTMNTRLLATIQRALVRTGVELMPFIPLPAEWYRKLLVRDSEKRYATGRWEYFRDITESYRYSIIRGCCEYYKPGSPTILDVGCGEGVLQERCSYSRYVGIDMNSTAIGRAKAREDSKTEFILSSARDYTPKDVVFDVIVFNESLYYIQNPIDVLQQYRSYLASEGIVIVCMFQTYLARRIWKELHRIGLTELSYVKIVNEPGFAAIVRVYGESRPPPG